MIDPRITFGRLGNSLFQYAYIYAQFKRGEIPDIFLQDPKYFEDYEEEIQVLFGGMETVDYVSIHVRRGANPINPNEPKYADNPFYVNLTETDYYERAISMFPVDKFLVFSDDVAYCKEKWSGDKRFKFVEKGNEIDDLSAMSACKHNIIANSSYSWWAAYLNRNKNKQIICPKNWFADGIQRTKFPKTWIQI